MADEVWYPWVRCNVCTGPLRQLLAIDGRTKGIFCDANHHRADDEAELFDFIKVRDIEVDDSGRLLWVVNVFDEEDTPSKPPRYNRGTCEHWTCTDLSDMENWRCGTDSCQYCMHYMVVREDELTPAEVAKSRAEHKAATIAQQAIFDAQIPF